jgi:predicted neuraminidase
MRDTRPDGKVGVALTQDAGAHWKDLPDLALPNPDSAVAGLAVDTGQLLLAHNPTSVGRARLDLSYSQDGRNWKLLQILEQGAPGDEFSYPALAWVDGSLWVSYTMDRQRLAWQRLAPVQKTPEAKP